MEVLSAEFLQDKSASYGVMFLINYLKMKIHYKHNAI